MYLSRISTTPYPHAKINLFSRVDTVQYVSGYFESNAVQYLGSWRGSSGVFAHKCQTARVFLLAISTFEKALREGDRCTCLTFNVDELYVNEPYTSCFIVYYFYSTVSSVRLYR